MSVSPRALADSFVAYLPKLIRTAPRTLKSSYPIALKTALPFPDPELHAEPALSAGDTAFVATCAKHCPRVHHIQSATDLCKEWFREGDTVGITAGTSTPDKTISEVEQCLLGMNVPSTTLSHS